MRNGIVGLRLPRETPKGHGLRRCEPVGRFGFMVFNRDCAPVYTQHGLASQLSIGIEESMKHESSIHGDELVGLPKSALTNFVGTLSRKKLQGLNQALAVALYLFRFPSPTHLRPFLAPCTAVVSPTNSSISCLAPRTCSHRQRAV